MNNNTINNVDFQKIKDYIYDIDTFNNKSDIINLINYLKLIMIENKLIIENLNNYQIEILINIINIYPEYNLSYEIIGFTKKVLLISNKSHIYFNNDFEIYNKDETIPLLNTDTKDKYTNTTINDHFINTQTYDFNTDIKYEKQKIFYTKSDEEYDYEQEYSSDSDHETKTSYKIKNESYDEPQEDEPQEDESQHDESQHDESQEDESESNSEELNINQNDIVLSKLYNNNDYIFTKGESIIYVISVLNLFINLYILNFK